jgi:uncharacterized Fe-S cluster-containing MiaB family protein
MKILLIYPPFCTPASPPYSITALHSFLTHNSKHEFKVLDLNLKFHELKFPDAKKCFQDENECADYNEKAKQFLQTTKKCYSKNNNLVVKGETPELFSELFKSISNDMPDLVAFSVVYSSQAFYVQTFLKELKQLGITTVVGGPGVSSNLVADHKFNNEVEFLEFIEGKKIDHDKLILNTPLDFSVYPLKEYFTPKVVIPLKTTTTCFWQRCTFCAHYAKIPYFQYPLEMIKETIVKSYAKHFFMIDDMIPTKRLLDIAKMVKSLGITWSCQLRPTKDLTLKVLQELKDSGLTMVIWGVESGSQKVLDLINKGTIVSDVTKVLKDSHSVGIRNATYIMFGFPGEMEEDFVETVEFLEANKDNVDLVSTSIFGLQEGTVVYKNPLQFGICEINEEKRTVLDAKISYSLTKGKGLNREDIKRLFKKYKARIEAINKYPKEMNFFREHMVCVK